MQEIPFRPSDESKLSDEYCDLCMECIPHHIDEHEFIMKQLLLDKLESIGWYSQLIEEISMVNT